MNKSPSSFARPATGVLLASLVLPGLAALATFAPLTASAETAPEQTTVSVKYGNYQDSQANWDRVKVNAAQVYVQAPIAGEWSIEASGVSDNVSGATPYAHTQKSGASSGGKTGMSDERHAGDVKITRYLPRAAVSASLAYSTEHDYTSTAVGLDARWSTDDNNRTWTVGYGTSHDTIDNTYSGGTISGKHKNTQEFMGGVTQVLTPTDIAQFNLTRSIGSGYYNDPYKLYENRPDQRNAWIGLVRWNHYVGAFDASIRTSYRHYSDSFGVSSHTAGVEWVQPTGRWTFTPGVRYYSQSAANFYFDPVLNAQGQYDLSGTVQHFITLRGNTSADQRLAAFGALTLSMKASYAFTPSLVADVKYERYRQSAALHLGGAGSPGLDAFNANFMQVGLTYRF